MLLRLALGIIFVAAAYYKIKSPGAFAHQIFNYKILPAFLINPLAIVMPWVQLTCGVCLLIRQWTKGATLLVTLMLLVFQIALASALLRGLNVSCGCFEAGGDAATWKTFFRDTLFLLMATLFLWKQFHPTKEGLWISKKL